MATSNFNLDIVEIMEEAFERASGGVRTLRSGNDYRTARRSLNLMMMDWANRGLNMWSIEDGTLPLVAGTAEYTLPADTVDLIEHAIRSGTGTNQADIAITRISVSTYAGMPNKNTPGKPVKIYINRATAAPVINVWPVPDNDNYTLYYWRLRRIQDVGANGATTMDVPFRFMPALTAGLAFYIAQKIPEGERRAVLLNEAYEKLFSEAANEDRERATLRLVPGVR